MNLRRGNIKDTYSGKTNSITERHFYPSIHLIFSRSFFYLVRFPWWLSLPFSSLTTSAKWGRLNPGRVPSRSRWAHIYLNPRPRVIPLPPAPSDGWGVARGRTRHMCPPLTPPPSPPPAAILSIFRDKTTAKNWICFARQSILEKRVQCGGKRVGTSAASLHPSSHPQPPPTAPGRRRTHRCRIGLPEYKTFLIWDWNKNKHAKCK